MHTSVSKRFLNCFEPIKAPGQVGPQRLSVAEPVLKNSRFVWRRRVFTPAKGVADAPTTGTDLQDTKKETLEGPYHGKRAVVVGAGPGGSMAAILLARRGFDVKVYEKRKDPTVIPMEVQRSVTLLLNPEVTELLQDVGIEVPLGDYSNGITAFKSSTNITVSGDVTILPNVENGTKTLTERHSIAEAVLQAAVAQPHLDFVFEATCEDIDLDAKVARFSNAESKIEEVPYDLLVGADGINSCVRSALQSSGHLECTQRDSLLRYVSIRNLPIPSESIDCFTKTLQVGVANFFRPEKPKVGRSTMAVLYYRTENGCVQMNIVGCLKDFQSIQGREQEWVQEKFPIPFYKEWGEVIVKSLQEKALSIIGPVTYCSSYIGPDVALIGDACHSATPTLGIGANQAILDVKSLDKVLREHDGDLEKALLAYDQETRPQVAAIQELEFKHSWSALKGQNPLWIAFFLVYFYYHRIGTKWFPKLITPSVHSLMAASLITPKAALERFNREAYIFFGTGSAAVVGVLAWGLTAFGLP